MHSLLLAALLTTLATGPAAVDTPRPGRAVAVTVQPGRDHGPADLKLTTRFQRTEPSCQLSTLVSATWSVRSDGDGVLPLMAIRYRPRVGPDGSAPGNTAYQLPIRVERERGTPDVRRLTVKASYDDGQTWRTVPVHRSSDGWRALLTHPATGYVSLQASAIDADGNKVDQTIVRAYALG